MKEFDSAKFREEGHKIIDQLAEYLENISKKEKYPVLPDSDPDKLSDFFLEKLENNSEQELSEIINEFLVHSNHLHSPGYIGHQCTSPLPLASLTHLTAGLLNNGSAVYEMGPANAAMERALIKHIAAILGYNDNSDGFLTHGGSAGNLTALLAARQAMCEYNIWNEGVRANSIPGFIVSEQAHYSVSRNLKIMGLGDAATVAIPVDSSFKIRTDLLNETYKKAREDGINIIGVVANACSTATGSYDDLISISDFCRDKKLWMHVDGAHGMGVIMSDKYRDLVKGIERADSVIIDFHKMFLIPGLNTCVLFKDGDRSYETFAQKASYLFDKSHEKDWYNGAKRTLECTKSSLGLHVYSMFRYYGDGFFGDYIEKMYDLTSAFNDQIENTPDFESIIKPESNILCFRYTGRRGTSDLNTINLAIRKQIIKRGKFYIVQAELNEKVWLRLTIINPLTKIDDLTALLEEIRECSELPDLI